MAKDKYQEAYEKGKEDAKKAGSLDEFTHALSKSLPATKKDKSYDAGWEDGIEEKSGGCFITTACLKTKGLPDNCQELNELRYFRDAYIRNLIEGERLIREYYEIAPKIVEGINKAENSMEIYTNLYEKLALNLELIRTGKKDEALRNGLKIFDQLKKEFLQ